MILALNIVTAPLWVPIVMAYHVATYTAVATFATVAIVVILGD